LRRRTDEDDDFGAASDVPGGLTFAVFGAS